MVIQRDRPFVIEGFCEGGKVFGILSSKDFKYTSEAEITEGKYVLHFPSVKGGFEKYNITVNENGKEIRLDNIVFGDVFLLSGQSNMKYSVPYMDCAKSLLRYSKDNIRFMVIDDERDENGFVKRSALPLEDSKYGGWHSANDKVKLRDLSGLGFMFAIDYSGRTGLPVGLIDVSVGGTSIDAHLSRETIENNETILSNVKRRGLYLAPDEYNKNLSTVSHNQMSGIFNEKINPLKNVQLRAVLWYQGESDSQVYANTVYYKEAIKQLRLSYKAHFNHEKLPFCLFHIALHNYHYHKYSVNLLNEAIDTLKSEDDVFIIPQYNIIPEWRGKGDLDYHNIHPINKREIALLASRILYSNLEKNIKLKAPYVSNISFKGNKAILKFNCGEKGLSTSDGLPPRGFEVCGDDGIFVKATATISEDEVTVEAEGVKEIKHVNFAFFPYNYCCNLVCDDIPALPFRSEDCNPAERNYYPFCQFLECGGMNAVISTFSPPFGGTVSRPAWRQGEWFATSSLKLSEGYYKPLKKRCIKLKYKASYKDNYMFSVSPVLAIPLENLGLKNYSRIKITLHCDKEIVDFAGIHFCGRDNIPYLFKAPQEQEKLKKGLQTITVDTQTMHNPGQIVQCTPGIRDDIMTLQFTFYSKADCTILFLGIELTN